MAYRCTKNEKLSKKQLVEGFLEYIAHNMYTRNALFEAVLRVF